MSWAAPQARTRRRRRYSRQRLGCRRHRGRCRRFGRLRGDLLSSGIPKSANCPLLRINVTRQQGVRFPGGCFSFPWQLAQGFPAYVRYMVRTYMVTYIHIHVYIYIHIYIDLCMLHAIHFYTTDYVLCHSGGAVPQRRRRSHLSWRTTGTGRLRPLRARSPPQTAGYANRRPQACLGREVRTGIARSSDSPTDRT